MNARKIRFLANSRSVGEPASFYVATGVRRGIFTKRQRLRLAISAATFFDSGCSPWRRPFDRHLCRSPDYQSRPGGVLTITHHHARTSSIVYYVVRQRCIRRSCELGGNWCCHRDRCWRISIRRPCICQRSSTLLQVGSAVATSLRPT